MRAHMHAHARESEKEREKKPLDTQETVAVLIHQHCRFARRD